jgi:hypothetical protein
MAQPFELALLHVERLAILSLRVGGNPAVGERAADGLGDDLAGLHLARRWRLKVASGTG